jgi:YD repeat-containing protein
VTTYAFDPLDRVVGRLYPDGSRVTFAFDEVGNRTKMQDRSGLYTYTYDPLGQLDSLVNPDSRRTTFTYDGSGRRTVTQLGNGTRSSVVYDAADRITGKWDLRADNSVVIGLDYENDPANNRTRMREATGRLTTWTYDVTNQLVSEHRSSTVGGFYTTHVYDPVGNRLVKNEAGSRTTSTYDAANQLVTAIAPDGVTTFTFDAAGNQQIESGTGGITTNVWDYENQRTGVLLPSGARETMVYNANFRNVRTES